MHDIVNRMEEEESEAEKERKIEKDERRMKGREEPKLKRWH